jgi:hypothetical protein
MTRLQGAQNHEPSINARLLESAIVWKPHRLRIARQKMVNIWLIVGDHEDDAFEVKLEFEKKS